MSYRPKHLGHVNLYVRNAARSYLSQGNAAIDKSWEEF